MTNEFRDTYWSERGFTLFLLAGLLGFRPVTSLRVKGIEKSARQ